METKEPPLIPEVPDAIFEAAEKGRLILFIGAGVSNLLGYPSWNEFAEETLDYLCQKKVINYAHLTLLNSLSPRTKLSIALDVGGDKISFKEILKPKPGSPSNNIPEHICSIGVPIVTTNYDECLDKEVLLKGRSYAIDPEIPDTTSKKISPDVIYDKRDFTEDKLSKFGYVIHLHGSVKNQSSMVISTRDYLKHNQDNYVKIFLRDLFKDYTVLFIGYGLEENEILEYVLGKRENSESSKVKNHYMLFPCYRYQTELTEHLKQYYQNHCGVELIEYRIDEKNHAQLSDVIRDWAYRLTQKAREQNFIEKTKIIDKGLRNAT